MLTIPERRLIAAAAYMLVLDGLTTDVPLADLPGWRIALDGLGAAVALVLMVAATIRINKDAGGRDG